MASSSFKYSIRVNQHSTVRLKIGAFLRGAADLIDGRITAALELRSRPSLSVCEKTEIIKAGFKTTESLLRDTVMAKAIDDLVCIGKGDLYGPLS